MHGNGAGAGNGDFLNASQLAATEVCGGLGRPPRGCRAGHAKNGQ